MPYPKKVRLIVEVPDPGEWCENMSTMCKLFEHSRGGGKCRGGFPITDARRFPSGMLEGFLRPQSCKDSEVKP